MPSFSSLSCSTASILQAPLFHQHPQLSKATIHLLPLPHQLSTSSDIGSFTMTSEAVSLANAAAEAARDALQLAHALAEIDPFLFTSTLRYGQHENCLREGRRRWRQRKGVELDVGGKDNVEGRGLPESCLSKVERLRYLTRDQEAEFSSCLKVDTMIEVPSSRKSSSGAARKRWRRNDRALLRARECRERITMSFKRLVVSLQLLFKEKASAFRISFRILSKDQMKEGQKLLSIDDNCYRTWRRFSEHLVEGKSVSYGHIMESMEKLH